MPPRSHRKVPPTATSSRPTGAPARLLASTASFLLFLSSSLHASTELENGTPSGWGNRKSSPDAIGAAATAWDAAAATAVIYNSDIPESSDLAQFYAAKRGIPKAHLIGIPCPASETISREDYLTSIRDPLLRELTARGLIAFAKSDDPNTSPILAGRSIRILAPVFGIPVRIARTPGEDGKPRTAPDGKGDEASVDAELALIGTPQYAIEGPLKNPYYAQDIPFPSIDAPPTFLVARLDGPSPEIIQKMVTDSIAAESSGLLGFAFFDLAQKGPGYEAGDTWISGAERMLRSHGFPTIVDPHPDRFPAYYPMRDAAFYFGWYTGHIDGPFLNPNFSFVPGAIACHLHSFSGEELRQSTRHWTGPLLRRGAAASVGNVWEPYLALTIHFDLLTDRLIKGYTFAEAASMATPALSWMNVAVGDPLYRPFKSNLLLGPPVGEPQVTASDFALFQALAAGRPEDSESKSKRALVEAATKRRSGLLLEGAGLLSAADSRFQEAADLFEHASATYTATPDKIRTQLHIADMRRRALDLPAAKATLEAILASFPDAPESRAAHEFLSRLQKETPPAVPPPSGEPAPR